MKAEKYDKDGREIMDSRPMQPPLGYKRAPTLAEQIRYQVLAAKLEALNDLAETEDEADDFEVGEDFEPLSPHENEHIPSIKALRKRAQEINDEIKRINLENLRKQMEGKAQDKPKQESPPPPESSAGAAG